MKKITLALFILLRVTIVNAQISHGTWMLSSSSNLGFNSYSVKSSSTNPSVFSISTRAGYFAADNFAFGVNLGFLSISSGGTGSATNSTTIGLFGRGFLGKGLFLGAGYSSSTVSGANGQTYTLFPLEFGYAGFIAKNFAIEPSLNYVASGDSDKGGVPLLGLPSSASSSIGLNVAFTFYLNRGDLESK